VKHDDVLSFSDTIKLYILNWG